MHGALSPSAATDRESIIHLCCRRRRRRWSFERTRRRGRRGAWQRALSTSARAHPMTEKCTFSRCRRRRRRVWLCQYPPRPYLSRRRTTLFSAPPPHMPLLIRFLMGGTNGRTGGEWPSPCSPISSSLARSISIVSNADRYRGRRRHRRLYDRLEEKEKEQEDVAAASPGSGQCTSPAVVNQKLVLESLHSPERHNEANAQVISISMSRDSAESKGSSQK